MQLTTFHISLRLIKAFNETTHFCRLRNEYIVARSHEQAEQIEVRVSEYLLLLLLPSYFFSIQTTVPRDGVLFFPVLN